MKFLEYTKKLYEKVAYYDSFTKRDGSMHTNPFARQKNKVTVIWVNEKEN